MGSAGTEGIYRAIFSNTTEKVLNLCPTILNYLSVLKGDLRDRDRLTVEWTAAVCWVYICKRLIY